MLSTTEIKLLNKIRDEINIEYGFKSGVPRINLGPCGSFVRIFYMIWNELLQDRITICFLFSPEDNHCIHCFIKLPDGNYFDGGNGVVPASSAVSMVPGNWTIEEMEEYDESRLERNANGFNRRHSNCQNFSEDKVRFIVESHLKTLCQLKS